MNRKILNVGWLFGLILVLDIFTKQWALDALAHEYSASFGWIPLHLTFNTGVAFGLGVGGFRWIIVAGSILVMAALAVLLRQADPADRLRIAAIGSVMAGATGNLIDRLRWDRGVVDFIGPFNLFGLGSFPIFNVADMAITCGAFVLAISLWLEERAVERSKAAVETSTDLV
ncbi:MAG: signal peptidase II [Gemmatimonadota bacterium]